MSWASEDLLCTAVAFASSKGLLAVTDYLFIHERFMSKALQVLGNSLQSQSSGTLRNPRRFKNNKQSSSLREQGNQYFRSSHDLENLEQALELYTKSIAYATPGSIELAFGYANRAVALLKLNRPMEALEDLERAFENNYPKKSQAKLWSRRGEAYAKLAEYNYIAAKHWLDETPVRDRSLMEGILKNYSALKYKDTIDVVREVPVLESPNEKYPFCSDAVEVQYTGKFDKKVVATRDIDIAETLVIDVPYSLTPDDVFFYTHCTFCLNSFWNGIPCDECIHVLYCSETCKQKAWKEYHRFECPIRDCVMQYDGFYLFQMGRVTRLLLQMHHEAGGLQQLKERVGRFYHCDHSDKDKDRWYRERTLETALMVDSYIHNAPYSDRMGLAAIVALGCLYYLGTTTNFFGIQYSVDRNSTQNVVAMSQHPEVQFTGALLLKLALAIWTNTLTCNELVPGDVTKYHRGFLFLPFSGTFKLECHSNAVGQCLENNYVLHCVRPIKKGEELTIPFGKPWINDEKTERNKFLMNLRSTSCTCPACTNNWPTIGHLQSYNKLPLSAESKAKISRVMRRFPKLHERILDPDLLEPERTLDELKIMFKVVYQEVDFPCLELTQIYATLSGFYQMISKVSKLKKLHTTPDPDQ